jgi:hypothetical protein
MARMKDINIEANEAFEKYEREKYGRKGQLSDDMREMFIEGYIQRIFDEITSTLIGDNK